MRNLTNRERYTLFNTWSGAIDRCHNPKNNHWSYYGGRGISVCDRWRDSFDAFVFDMGARPEGTSLDRIDVNKNYEPDNCRWADKFVQARNRRDSKLTLDDINRITELLLAGHAAKDIAFFYGVTSAYIRMLKQRNLPSTPTTSHHRPGAKLSEALVEEIRTKRAAGSHPADLALQYGVSVKSVYNILSGRTWQTNPSH